ncbi:family 78 glycoside hydrolase catalytic domain [Paraflavitalea pollutisoli]|uniref:family 78 glycoside hydrolase catalytic domain n=1 Tax=Paraflavitalea pollutisoli TaxID=3034143 RepID=UPI0023EC16AD|nr:family 78 glycoside hydrolase catalytic domain [Paraflavitalea sp. H1-2-19X]
MPVLLARRTCLLLPLLLLSSLFTFAQTSPEPLKTAQWIFHPTADPHAYGVFHYRKQFNLPVIPRQFIVYISGDNRYQLFVNGKRIALGPAKGDVEHWRYETVNIAPALVKGRNTIAALTWNEGEHLAWSQITYQSGLMIRGVTSPLANTDTSWKVMENRAYQPIPAGNKVVTPFEKVHADQYPWGWEYTSYDDRLWQSAKIMEGGTAHRLVPNRLPFPEENAQRFRSVRRSTLGGLDDQFIKGSYSVTVPANDSVTAIIDQGILTTAFPELLVSGGKGASITLTYAEALYDSAGNKGNRNEIRGKRVRGNADQYLPDGGTNRLFRPLYYRTFRYIELKIKTGATALQLHDLRSVFTAYPFKENASFVSDDPSLTAIWNTGWRTARLCAYETYMDCPYYEQLQYVGDTRIQALISYYVSGDDRLVRNAIEQFSHSMLAEGLTHSRYPESMKQVIPPFSLLWISMVHDYWRHRPDTAFVKQYLVDVKKILDWHKRYLNRDSMLGHMPYWNFVDWPAQWPWTGVEETSGVPAGTVEGNSSILTLQYAYAIDRAVELFKAFQWEHELVGYSKLAANIKAATLKHCWNNERKLLADDPKMKDYSQHANVLAVLTNAVPVATGKALIKRVAYDSTLIQCTYYYRFYLNQAMKKAGWGDDYVAMLQPWKDMLNLGLTTFSERPEPTRSDCHAWSASPNYDFLATIAGIEPASPGFGTVKIAPHLGTLNHIEGKLPVPAGEIQFTLTRNGSAGIQGKITLPKGMTGNFYWKGKRLALKPGSQAIKL